MFSAALLLVNAGHALPLLLDLAVKSVAVSAAALATLVCLRQAPAATRHLALLAGLGVLLGLPMLMALLPRRALPPTVGVSGRASVTGLNPRASNGQAPAFAGEDFKNTPMPAQVGIRSITARGFSPVTEPVTEPATTQAPPAPAPAFRPAWLVLGWLAGVLACAGRMLAAQARVWRLTRRCPPLPPSLLASTDLETDGFAALLTGPAETPPMVWGWPRPVLLLPPEAADWPPTRLRAIVLHESAHVRRQDWLTQTLTQAACALYWFNPLVWLLAARLGAEAERACDDAVLLAGVPPTDYAQELLAVARHLGAGRTARRVSVGAVTMARRSPVRGRLEAILDTRRVRRHVSRRSVALALAAAFAVAAPLAVLRPAARADEGQAGQAAPTAGIPTEADVAQARQHLLTIEQMRTDYVAAHPNRLTSAQAALVDRLRKQVEVKDDVERNFAREIGRYAQARAEAKKPRSTEEQEKIQQTIYGYEHTTPSAVESQQTFERTFGPRFAELKRKVGFLPAEQTARASRIYCLSKAIALDETRVDIMQMERAEGFSLHMDPDDVALTARFGLDSELAGSVSRSVLVHFYLLDSKIGQGGRLDDADIAPGLAILRTRPDRESNSHLLVLSFFDYLRNAVPPQPRGVREAILPYLASKNYNERYAAKRVLRWFGGSVPTPAGAAPQGSSGQEAAKNALRSQIVQLETSLLALIWQMRVSEKAFRKTRPFAAAQVARYQHYQEAYNVARKRIDDLRIKLALFGLESGQRP